MLNLRDLRIDPASLGSKMLLVDVMPAYEYKDGKRTETVIGYRYVVYLAEHRLEKLSVRIDGPQLMEKPRALWMWSLLIWSSPAMSLRASSSSPRKPAASSPWSNPPVRLRTIPRGGWGLIFFPKEKYPPP